MRHHHPQAPKSVRGLRDRAARPPQPACTPAGSAAACGRDGKIRKGPEPFREERKTHANGLLPSTTSRTGPRSPIRIGTCANGEA